MSWWTNLRDTVETVATGGAALAFNESARNKIEGGFNRLTGRSSAEERRSQQSLVNDQIQAYKDQTNIAKQAADQIEGEKQVQKRLIQEKQIRSLRNNYRSAGGFLNNQASSMPAPGGVGTSPGITNKLGTS